MSSLLLPLCNIIIGYLTNPPKLPFESQLLRQTYAIKADLSIFWYSMSSYKILSKYVRNGRHKISYNNRYSDWGVSK